MTDSAQTIRDRSFAFACAVVRVALETQPRAGIRSVINQLVESATSVGANLEEAKAGSSTREFVRYVEIALREAREAIYWLRICAATGLAPSAQLTELGGEADQIVRILGSIVVKTKFRMRAGHAVFAFCILNFALLFS
jgi:four helix bundle protein